jgi:hypothetical protein
MGILLSMCGSEIEPLLIRNDIMPTQVDRLWKLRETVLMLNMIFQKFLHFLKNHVDMVAAW